MVESIVQCKPSNTAAEFIKVLRRSDELWLPRGESQSLWLFRGVNSEKHELLPKAWRPEIEEHPVFESIRDDDYDEFIKRALGGVVNPSEVAERRARRIAQQHAFEHAVLSSFAHFMNDIGYPLPGGFFPRQFDQSTIEVWERLRKHESAFHPAYAIAQHHGLPTPLLDWTHNPLYAAFFASSGADADLDGNLVVWALNRRNLYDSGEFGEFHVERASSGYLHAQEACFTFAVNADTYFMNHGEWPRLDQCLRGMSLVKLLLPKRERRELRRLLFVERCTAAHLMPSLDNIKTTLDEYWAR